MNYNLIKMFGLDDDIRSFAQAWIQWFSTPPMNTEAADDASEDGEEDGTEEGGDDAEAEEDEWTILIYYNLMIGIIS